MTPQEARNLIGKTTKIVLCADGSKSALALNITIVGVHEELAYITYEGITTWVALKSMTKYPFGVRAQDGDWIEDFAHENGCYMCRCFDCAQIFHGHKRRAICKTCHTDREALKGIKEAPGPLPIGGDHHVAAWVWEGTGGIFWASRLTSKHQATVTVREWEKRGDAPKGIIYMVLEMGVITDEPLSERVNYWRKRALGAEARLKAEK